MEIVEVKCKKCGKEIYVLKNYVRKEMFCKLGCMNSYYRVSNSTSIVNIGGEKTIMSHGGESNNYRGGVK